jgi:hypothetical protein
MFVTSAGRKQTRHPPPDDARLGIRHPTSPERAVSRQGPASPCSCSDRDSFETRRYCAGQELAGEVREVFVICCFVLEHSDFSQRQRFVVGNLGSAVRTLLGRTKRLGPGG